ncbi:MAG TPA: hypothetical protein VFH71_03185 [Rhodanobacteraceae bacterium]|nr:hypothetical protein [Rhodanobacteraceae bacterium]
MTKKPPKQPDWNKAQPHSARTGRITTKKYAVANPDKVEWVTVKKGKGVK